MTKVGITVTGNNVRLRTKGHCEHDVCVAVSALTNAAVQLAEDFERESRCEVNKVYKRGNVELRISFYDGESKKDFLSGMMGIVSGFKLYEANFPEEIEFSEVTK